MDTHIVVELREVYGRIVAYPVNDQAQRLADIVGTKTLTVATLRAARDMGFALRRRDAYGATFPTSLEAI